jgi:serine/threonine protein kinase
VIASIDGFEPAAPVLPEALPPALHGIGALPFEAPPRYQLLRVLGSGAMGTVILARDRGAARLVALKVLRETCPAFLERFEREARLLARLVHPAIVRLYDFELRAGRPFLAMAYAPGGNLAQARLDSRALAAALRDVASALACAHASGVVHRDVKPENVLLDDRGARGGYGRAQLADFGLALEREESRSPRPVAGSLASMSPEQVRGEPVGPASDVFSLGATLYRKLTGTWPFPGRSVADVIRAIQEEAPVPPRERAAGVPRPLETLALDCLAKDPCARPAIDGVEAELARFLGRRSFPARVARLFARVAQERRPLGPRIHPEEWS